MAVLDPLGLPLTVTVVAGQTASGVLVTLFDPQFPMNTCGGLMRHTAVYQLAAHRRGRQSPEPSDGRGSMTANPNTPPPGARCGVSVDDLLTAPAVAGVRGPASVAASGERPQRIASDRLSYRVSPPWSGPTTCIPGHTDSTEMDLLVEPAAGLQAHIRGERARYPGT